MASAARDLPLFPLEAVVLFPGMPLRLHVFEQRYRNLVADCEAADGRFGVCLIRSGLEVGAPADPFDVGCVARIEQVHHLPDGGSNLMARGERRFRLLDRAAVGPGGYLQARAALPEEDSAAPPALVEVVQDQLRQYLAAVARLAREDPPPFDAAVARDPLALSFQVGAALKVAPRTRQRLLEASTAEERLRRGLFLLRRETQTALLMERAPASAQRIGPFSVN